MAQRDLENGRDERRTAQQPRPSTEPSPPRGADVSPPGSRERSESDVTGWTPEREPESLALRQGRFHRAASERLYNPRGGPTAGDVGPRSDGGQARSGRIDERPGPSRGLRPRSEDEPRYETSRYEDEARPTPGRYEERGRYDAALGMDYASPGVPGLGVGPGGLLGPARPSFSSEARTDARTEARPRGRRWRREPLTARELMTRGVKSVRPERPLREVAQLMRDEDCGVVPVVDEAGHLLGLVTDRDIVIRAFAGARNPGELRASDVMTDDVQAVTPDEDIHGVIELMGRHQVRRVPVVDRDDRLLGIISLGDIAHRADYDEELQEALERISSRRSFWSRLR